VKKKFKKFSFQKRKKKVLKKISKKTVKNVKKKSKKISFQKRKKKSVKKNQNNPYIVTH